MESMVHRQASFGIRWTRGDAIRKNLDPIPLDQCYLVWKICGVKWTGFFWFDSGLWLHPNVTGLEYWVDGWMLIDVPISLEEIELESDKHTQCHTNTVLTGQVPELVYQLKLLHSSLLSPWGEGYISFPSSAWLSPAHIITDPHSFPFLPLLLSLQTNTLLQHDWSS